MVEGPERTQLKLFNGQSGPVDVSHILSELAGPTVNDLVVAMLKYDESFSHAWLALVVHPGRDTEVPCSHMPGVSSRLMAGLVSTTACVASAVMHRPRGLVMSSLLLESVQPSLTLVFECHAGAGLSALDRLSSTVRSFFQTRTDWTRALASHLNNVAEAGLGIILTPTALTVDELDTSSDFCLKVWHVILSDHVLDSLRAYL
ncbi:MAG: hypothetical protein QXQ81_09885, partial [Candidatus Thorarchaeota archaeon]